MNNIPKKLREEMSRDPYYQRCCLTKLPNTIAKIEWHHNLIYAGRQVQEKWAILPLEQGLHEKARERWVKDLLDWIMLNRADSATLIKYSKAVDLTKRRDTLNEIYGKYEENIAVL